MYFDEGLKYNKVVKLWKNEIKSYFTNDMIFVAKDKKNVVYLALKVKKTIVEKFNELLKKSEHIPSFWKHNQH